MADWADGRLGSYALGRTYMRKVFPDHWSFMLGEVCLYSFLVLVLTGVWPTLFCLTGYSLPDGLLSGTGLRFAQGAILSIPVVGTYLAFFLFGGEFPGDDIISRLYPIHVLVLPGIILALVVAHLALVFYHKHTQYPGPGHTENTVTGMPFLPVYLAKAGGFFFLVFGILSVMGAVATINPVWAFGPYRADLVTTGAQPDWYLGFSEGLIRGDAGLGDQRLGPHPPTGRPHPLHALPAAARRDWRLPLHRGVDHRRPARAPRPGPAAQRPQFAACRTASTSRSTSR